MSIDSTVTEVFEDVEPDPDAILEAWDAETPAELVESGGRHGTDSDDEIDDVTAAELFAALGDEDATDPTSREADPDSGDALQTDDTDPDSDRNEDLEFEFVGDSAAALRNDGDVIDATAADLGALTVTDATSTTATDAVDGAETAAGADSDPSEAAVSSWTLTVRDGSPDELELVGPEPTRTRVADEAFGSPRPDAQ